ncbi:3'-5' exoribonuclease YhaM [Companilactobacillus sp. RD055328]|uniref:3'-5' exoribonuclease YhaM family protein n=1 Tax=Companilactobacillus sp. RD055328 TaxID=2916634 RepID=UPI001FC8C548|nr:HD domain-containing protein [Companilactobacillus sp. RD055328]GKQ42489.1 3'-5' exoribonuclease YhaM [Companilactobacillus sp. RD055328]
MTNKLTEYKVNDVIDLNVLIKQSDLRVAKNGKNFLSLVFEDASGTISGKYWDAKETDAQTFGVGKVVHLTGKKELYQNSPQVKIASLDAVDEALIDKSQFVKTAPMTKDEMEKEFNEIFFEITNPVWNRVVRNLIQKHEDIFFTHPAAKSNHHDFEGGLAYHTLSMVRLAKSISSQYPEINKELLIAGAMIHDFGKTVELSGSIGTEYTLEGNLLGHIVIIDEEIVLIAKELGIDDSDENLILLRHMVLSHHGLLEYGSPERPKILEAEILHTIDELDASINMITKALDNTQKGNFSERIFGLDNRSFYKY